MAFKDTKVLEFYQNQKSDKTPSIIYTDLESLTKRIDKSKNNFEKPFTTKVGENISCAYSLSTIWTFNGTKNKHELYRDEECMNKSCESFRKHAMEMTNFGKKK